MPSDMAEALRQTVAGGEYAELRARYADKS